MFTAQSLQGKILASLLLWSFPAGALCLESMSPNERVTTEIRLIRRHINDLQDPFRRNSQKVLIYSSGNVITPILDPMTITSLKSLQAFVDCLPVARHWRFTDVAYILAAFYAAVKVSRAARGWIKTTALRGPPNPSFLLGLHKVLFTSRDSGAELEKWAEKYGGVYEVAAGLGGKRIMLCDPKAIAHLYGGEPWTYILPPAGKIATENFVGKGILSAVGESHRRQRKILTPAFSNAAIRNLTPVFYDSVYKAKGAWDSLIESDGDGSAVIEVQTWMNRISLDTIGIAGFSHDFGSLDGKPTTVTEVFDAIGNHGGQSLLMFIISFAQIFPWILHLPTPHSKLIKRLNDTMGAISTALLIKTRKEKEAGTLGEREERSILGLLIKAENQDNQLRLTPEEVTSQAKVLLLAGYETTSISLTWALIELAKNSDIQTKLRTELLEFGADPTYDQLSTNLPYLDAVVHETLRMHPPLLDFTRMAAVDDVIPLSKPVLTRSGKLVDHISVAKGTRLSVSVPSINRSTALWGLDAKVFNPDRWIKDDGIPAGAREVQGHRHMLTFIDGPRTCLGKGFAIAEFKTVLSVLVKHFVFDFPDGPETEIEMARGILSRPKVAGEENVAVPLRVRRFE